MAKRTATAEETAAPPKRGGEWREAFLAHLGESGNVRASCKDADVSPTVVYDHKKRDQAFAAQWDQAMDQGCDLMVDEALRRAVRGVDEPVFYQGERVGWVKRYSDTLLIFLLKSHRPAVYGERVQIEHAVQERVKKLAEQYGLSVSEVLAEVHDILRP